MSTSKASSLLKYSIATFLLCTSAFTTGVFIYPVSLAILNATTIPLLFVAIASVSAIIALSSTVYLVKSAIFAINNKNTCNILEEKPHGNDTSTPSLPTLNSITNNDISTKAPEKMSALQVPQVSVPAPPPFPNQGVSVPPPPPLPTEGLNNWKLQKDSAISKKLLDSGSSKNSSFTKPKDHSEGLQEELKKCLENRRKNSQHLSNVEIKDSTELKTQEEYAIRVDSKLEKKKKHNRDEGTLAAIIREKVNSIRQCASFSSSESEHSGNESGWSDDNQDIQSSKKKEGKKLIEAQKSMPSTTTSSKIESNSAPFIPAPPPFPNQGVSVPPPPPLPTEGLNNWKLQKDSAISKKLLDSGSSKNSSFTKPKDHSEGLQEELKKCLENRRKNSQHLSNVEIKDSTELKTQEEYIERVEKQQEEKNQVESQNDHDFIRSMILEYILPSIKFTDTKKGENSEQSSGYASDLEEDQPPKSKNLQLLPTTVMKIDNVDPINSEAKKSSLWKNLFKKHKKKAEQKTPECVSKV
ncbi:hypothetical protein [Wolbachia endosymbiont (group B) of Protocalliphora azurea]|uniref:hypothetical protein n=1 Tax=Wolbachia endosymbiont (group B) of Protocalliphora azurea TaxID=2954051 RepID=UPI0022311264|nr:hypothetical protein [Wolbachia endosymbiont (group B) of Protocalliphora azurea]